MECRLCGPNAWQGPGCKTCPGTGEEHYVEGIGSAEGSATCFCVAESPLTANVSRDPMKHTPWSYDAEQSVKQLFNEALDFRRVSCRFTYAVRCEHNKPTKKHVTACRPLFQKEILKYAKPDGPIMVFALGAAVLKAFDIKQASYKKAQGKFFETTLEGRRVVVFPSLSKRQLMSNASYLEVSKRHVDTFLEAVVRAQNKAPINVELPTSQITENYRFPETVDELRELTEEVINYAPEGVDPSSVPLSIDTETNTLYPHRSKLKILTLVLSWAPGMAASIPIEHEDSPLTLEQVAPYVQRLLTCDKPKIFHNLKYDLRVLEAKGWSVTRIAWDTMIGEHLLEEDKKGFYSLKELVRSFLPEYKNYEEEIQAKADAISKRRKDLETAVPLDDDEKLSTAAKKLQADVGYEDIPLKVLGPYGAIDADVTRQLAVIQLNRMKREQAQIDKKRKDCTQNKFYRNLVRPPTNSKLPLRDLHQRQIIPVIRTLARMESTGIRVDHDYVDELSYEMDKSLSDIDLTIRDMVPSKIFPDFNPGSTQQLASLLFSKGYIHPETEKLVCYKGKVEPPRTATGQISTNAKFLRSLVTQHGCPFTKAVLDFRAVQKARNTFLENIRVLSLEDGRMHTSFHPHGTATGRLCVSKDTLLDTDKGSFEISKLDLTKTQNISIITHKGRKRKIKNVFYKGKEEMYRVRLENGSEIKVTRNHRFFTPAGVLRLKELEIGAYVTTFGDHDTSSERGSDHRRRRLRTTVPSGAIKRRRVQGDGSVLQGTDQLYSSLPRKIQKRDKEAEALQVLHSHEREHTREKGCTCGCVTQRTTRGTARNRLQYTRDRKPVRRECVVRAPKHEAPFVSKNGEATLQDGGHRSRIPGTPGTVFSGAYREYLPLLRRPTSLLQKPLCSVLHASRAALVCKRARIGSLEIPRSRQNPERPHLLESEPARTTALDGTPLCRHPFLFSPCRSRWRVPQERQGNERARQETETRCFTARVQDASLLDERSDRPYSGRSGDDTFGTQQIVSIEPIGIDEVWDIEVEEDHSYVAQGFVNHNSSSDENMQNVPKKIGDHNIKKCFIPTDPGSQLLVQADAKAAEVRIYAAYSRDENLIKALNEGLDPHSFFSSMVLNPANVLKDVPASSKKVVLETIGIDDEHEWSYEDFEKRDYYVGSKEVPGPDVAYGRRLGKLRSNIKRVVFGILYGAYKAKIAGIVGITEGQAQAIIDSLFKMFPTIERYIQNTKDQVAYMHMVETFFGRRRRFPNWKAMTYKMRNKAERQAVNFKIQSTSSEIVMRVLTETDEPVRRDFGGRHLITVHDSAVMEIPTDYVTQIPDFFEEYGVTRVAEYCKWLPVPFKWDVEVGPSYGELQPIAQYLETQERVAPSLLTTEEEESDYLENEIRKELLQA